MVKLHVFVDNLDLLKGTLFTSETSDATLSIKLKNATAKHWLAEVENIIDRTEAEKLRGTNLYINKTDLPDLDEGENYVDDLIGLKAVDEKDTVIGKIIAFENFGASDLLEIKPDIGASFYLPYTDDTVIDILSDKIIVIIPEGLID